MSHDRDSEKRVVVTGVGVVSPCGIGADAYWDSLRSGTSGVSTIEFLSASPIPGKIGGEVKGWDANPFLTAKEEKKRVKVMTREISLGWISAKIGLEHAGIAEGAIDPQRLGVDFGANLMFSPPSELSRGCFRCIDESDGKFHFEHWGKLGMREMFPLWLLMYLPNMPACHIGISADARGPNNSITMDDASGNLVVGEALRVIARGHADVMITGTTGTRLHSVKSIHAALWDKLAEVTGNPAQAMRPFDLHRTGQVVAEAACTLILEEESHAIQRGAKIFGRILGAGSACVCSRDGQPDIQRALVLAMKAALSDARLQPGDIGHINAHGVGTIEGDRQEAAAIHEVFGDYGSKVPVTAIKSYTGNAGSGSGVLEMAASFLGLSHGILPHTLNYETPDPTCRLNIIGGKALPLQNKTFLKLSVTRRGQASAVIASGV